MVPARNGRSAQAQKSRRQRQRAVSIRVGGIRRCHVTVLDPRNDGAATEVPRLEEVASARQRSRTMLIDQHGVRRSCGKGDAVITPRGRKT